MSEDPILQDSPEEPREEARPLPAPSRGSSRGLFWGLLGGCLGLFVILTILGAVGAAMSNREEWTWSLRPAVAVVLVEGEILDARDTVDQLREFADDSNVRALVVRVNSPGGGIVPSQEIFAEIRRLREETGKPIIASLDSVAASGGYYVAAGCESIVANPGTITGSIGVIAQWMNVGGLVRWARLEPETIVSGSMKDAGSPYRELAPAEREYLQGIVDSLHRQFVGAVVLGRQGKLTREEIEVLADGRVFTGEEALELKLVDELGTLQDAVELAGRRGGISGQPRMIFPRERTPGLLEVLTSGESARTMVHTLMGNRVEGTRFLYRWY